MLHAGASNLCAESGHDIGVDPQFRDLGDLALGAPGEGLERIESGVGELLNHGARVISLGGDHAITYPILRAYAAHHDDLTVLQLDAHPDLYDEFDGNRLSHACPFARILEEGAIRRLVQVGIRTMNADQRARAERFHVEVIEMRELAERGVPTLEPPFYLSIDLDALDPAFAPGVGHHEPGGMTTRQVIDLVQQLAVAPVGADIVELIPPPRRPRHDRRGGRQAAQGSRGADVGEQRVGPEPVAYRRRRFGRGISDQSRSRTGRSSRSATSKPTA